MSNMIKAHTVRYDQVGLKTIDSHLKMEHKIIFNHRAVEDRRHQDGFVEGISATLVETIDEQEDIEEKATNLLEEARLKAAQILEEAEAEAKRVKREAYETAKEQGYEAGRTECEKKFQILNKELKDKEIALKEEYEQLFTDIEPNMVNLLATLLEKITGVLAEDQNDIIRYLIRKSLKNIDKSTEYTIKVSKEDFERVSSLKTEFLEDIDRDVKIYIVESYDLQKNQCLIETDYTVINCSLDVQINNLITQMKLLSLEV